MMMMMMMMIMMMMMMMSISISSSSSSSSDSSSNKVMLPFKRKLMGSTFMRVMYMLRLVPFHMSHTELSPVVFT